MLLLAFLVTVFTGMAAGATFDFGDAQRPADDNYPTTKAEGGSRHEVVDVTFLGPDVDKESDALPADSYDDGVVSISSDTLTFKASAGSGADNLEAFVLNVLVDLNNDGDWNDSGEWMVQDKLYTNYVSKGSTKTYTAPVDIPMVACNVTDVGWMRVTLTENYVKDQIETPYTGKGRFDWGESEDHLVDDIPCTDEDGGGVDDVNVKTLDDAVVRTVQTVDGVTVNPVIGGEGGVVIGGGIVVGGDDGGFDVNGSGMGVGDGDTRTPETQDAGANQIHIPDKGLDIIIDPDGTKQLVNDAMADGSVPSVAQRFIERRIQLTVDTTEDCDACQLFIATNPDNTVREIRQAKTGDNPQVRIETDPTTIKRVLQSDSPRNVVRHAIASDDIRVKGTGIISSLKYGAMTVFAKVSDFFTDYSYETTRATKQR